MKIGKFWSRFGLLALIAAALVLAYGVYIRGQARSPVSTGNRIGQQAPDFTGRTLDGREISLQDYRGRIVFVNLFASWCGPCLVETPHLVESHRENGEQVVFLGINLQEPPGAVEGYRDAFQVEYPLLLDPDGRFTERFAPPGLPTSWVIDEEGIIRYVHAGPLTQDMLEEVFNTVHLGRQSNLLSSLR